MNYWFGPLSGWLPNRWWAGRPDLAFVWNGIKQRYLPSVRLLRELGAHVVYVEHGWYPQQATVQLDDVGVNIGASWANKPLAANGQTPLQVRDKGDLLLLLQYDRDTQLTDYSPWFRDMAALVDHVTKHSALRVRVRPHPRHPPAAGLKELVLSRGHLWDDSSTLQQALSASRALACINSSTAIEALNQRLPVLCFGESVYRHPGAVYCLDNQAAQLQAVTTELSRGQCSLFVEPITAVLQRVAANQFTVEQLHQRLPSMIDTWLGIARQQNVAPYQVRSFPALPFAGGLTRATV
ncbi:capsular polysaccharide export protein, LipB/KpsS family [Anatilimnocola floriformis]|uniref:capsular polysaccharide export protein, LipB/KpsS family n=1 Tax=Anatilimnocola floriformis TaxID=2948575 RepID=UPI0020C4B67A|nr:hypothetical protein [Anatilimnocola floriformis]